MVGTIQILTIDDVVEINRRMISEFGGIFFAGDDNLANPGSLEHLLDEIQGLLFGEELYPDIFEKAALLVQRIIVGHIFHDGNKRTGMESCRLFLEINGFDMRIDREVVNTAIQIATHEIQFNEIVSWLQERTRQRGIGEL